MQPSAEAFAGFTNVLILFKVRARFPRYPPPLDQHDLAYSSRALTRAPSVLRQGRTVFHGPPAKAQAHFSRVLGLHVPEGANPADVIMRDLKVFVATHEKIMTCVAVCAGVCAAHVAC
jgi:hypothetical protein